jgi:hypothetical protein
MITLSLLTLAVLWFVVLHRFPAYFVPKDAVGRRENWIEVMPSHSHRHHETPAMQEVG